jgi:uncharacterized membrane protein
VIPTRFAPHLLLWLLLLLTVPATAQALAEAGPDTAPEVRAVVFIATGCSACDELFDYVAPLLFERYGARLELAAVDTGTPAGAGVYRALGEAGQAPVDEPVVRVGDRSFRGLDAIVAGLGDGFEALAADPASARWSALPGLEALLPAGIETVHGRVAGAPSAVPPAAQTGGLPARDRIANGLAVVVLVGMALALLHALARVRRPGRRTARTSALVPLSLMAGLFISAYLAYTHITGTEAVCGPIGSCNAVQQSEYAQLFGIPLGVLGVMGYSLLLLTWLVGRGLSPRGGGWRWVTWAVALAGVLFSMRLTALEPFVIGATCLWCLGSAVAMTTTLWLLSGETRRAAGTGS